MFDEVQHIEGALATEDAEHYSVTLRKHLVTWYYYWPRQLVASTAWIANDFAFYGEHRGACILRSFASTA